MVGLSGRIGACWFGWRAVFRRGWSSRLYGNGDFIGRNVLILIEQNARVDPSAVLSHDWDLHFKRYIDAFARSEVIDLPSHDTVFDRSIMIDRVRNKAKSLRNRVFDLQITHFFFSSILDAEDVGDRIVDMRFDPDLG